MGRRPLCVCLLFFLTVFLTISHYRKGSDTGRQELPDGQRIMLSGVIEEVYEPLEQSEDQKILYLKQIKIQTLSVDQNSEFKKEDLKITGAVCYLDDGQQVPYAGAAVLVAGTAYPFQKASNPGEFDAAAYYELRGYQLKVYDAVVEKQSDTYDKTKQSFHEIRLNTARVFVLLLGDKNGALASAMVTGRKKDIDDTVKGIYQIAGISHILAISGLHISMVGGGVAGILKRSRLPLWAASFLAILLIIGYGVFTGMSVSTLRAVIMFMLTMIASMVRRTPDTLTSLLTAAAAVLIPEPGYLYDSGFQLSFSAVAGMAVAVPVLKERRPEPYKEQNILTKCKKWIWEGFCVSSGVSLAMLPFLLTHFYTWNPWSLILNPIVVYLTGILLPQLFFLAIMGNLFIHISGVLPILRILALPAGILFEIMEKAGSLISRLPGSCLHTGMPEKWQLTVFGAGLGVLLIFGKKIRPSARMAAAAVLACIFLIRFPGNLEITMLDVGQGAGFVVQTPKHHFYLLDAGSTSKSGVGQYQMVPYLKYSGVRKIEAVFISHWDEDHINGLADIFAWAQREQVAIGQMILPNITLEDEILKELLILAVNYNIPVSRMGAGDVLETEELRFLCLHPYQGELVADRNAASMVLKLECDNFAALFPGDLEEKQENWICSNFGPDLLDCQLLAAGHHGSSTSSTEQFLERVTPGVSLISCGKKNRYGHPHKEVLERFAQRKIVWYATPQCGAVIVHVKKDNLSVSKFLE